jgi:sigma-B regulation protein RsbU (phosphoserine phosphatase)
MTITAERDLEIARQIQSSFLPQTLPQLPGWEIATHFQPAREVAGDFYDVFPMIQNRRLGLVVADVCDKGVAAALFMSLCRTLIRAFAQQNYALNWTDVLADDPPQAATDFDQGVVGRRRGAPSIGANALKQAVLLTNNYIAQNHGETNMFATLFFGVLDPKTGSFNYINAGHNPPLIVEPSGDQRTLATTGPAIGLLPDLPFAIEQAQLRPGDTLLIYTDGVTEARNAHGAFFSEARLSTILAAPAPTAADLLRRIADSVETHRAGAAQSDDSTLLAIRRLSGD